MRATPKNSRDLQQIAAAEAKQFGDRVFSEVVGAFTGSIVEVAREALLASKEAPAGTRLNRTASVAASARERLEPIVDAEAQDAIRRASEIIADAMASGFETELSGTAHIYTKADTPFSAEVEVTEEDLRGISAFPVLGHTLDDWLTHIHASTMFDAVGVLVQPPAGGVSAIELVPARLEALGRSLAMKLRQLTTDAHLAGGRAGSIAWGATIAEVGRAG